jgi:Na+-driven multidrug efflux pump
VVKVKTTIKVKDIKENKGLIIILIIGIAFAILISIIILNIFLSPQPEPQQKPPETGATDFPYFYVWLLALPAALLFPLIKKLLEYDDDW